jgi:hypothetical protein
LAVFAFCAIMLTMWWVTQPAPAGGRASKLKFLCMKT